MKQIKFFLCVLGVVLGIVTLYGVKINSVKPNPFDFVDSKMWLATVNASLTEHSYESKARFLFQIPDFANVELFILNRKGERVRTLVNRHLSKGAYQISWYGETDRIGKLNQGVYIAALRKGAETKFQKIILH